MRDQARIPVSRCAFILLGILRSQGSRAVTKDLKNAPRIGRKPRSVTEVRIAPSRIIVFKPSAVLKERINRPNQTRSREQPGYSGSIGTRSARRYLAPSGS
ncbi:HU family DNA-binding protein [Bradyrhizobium sp. SRL28]|nr:HU family DNA-binding protein [Bradyrhizobium sp. SRL28]